MNPQFYNSYNHSYSSSLQSLSNPSSISNTNQLQSGSLDSGVASEGSGQSSGGPLHFNGFNVEPVANDINDDFKVPGRLALLNSNKKYNISIGEIKRRLGAPENMNSSLLGAMLRRFESLLNRI